MFDHRLEQVIEGVLNQPVTLTDETAIADLPGWDSVAHINLMFCLEQEFGVQFSNNEMAELQTIHDLKRLLGRRAAA